MCYGTCKYERADGECRVFGRFPEDATCMEDLRDDDSIESEDEE